MTLLELLPSLHHAATPRLDRSIWPLTTNVDELGRLCVGGVPLTEVADEFRTPTYVLDEADFRQRIRRYRATLPGVDVVYAGKSLLTTAVAHWVAEEGVGLDVCSGGELAIALAGARIRRGSSCTATPKRPTNCMTRPPSGWAASWWIRRLRSRSWRGGCAAVSRCSSA